MTHYTSPNTGNTSYLSNCGHFSSMNAYNVTKWDRGEMTIEKYNSLSDYDKNIEDCKGWVSQEVRSFNY